MIFCESKSKITKIAEELQEAKIPSLPFYDAKIMNSKMRNRTLALLHEGKLPVIVCDNLGSRGLDTMGVSHVIQFDFAKSPQDYL